MLHGKLVLFLVIASPICLAKDINDSQEKELNGKRSKIWFDFLRERARGVVDFSLGDMPIDKLKRVEDQVLTSRSNDDMVFNLRFLSPLFGVMQKGQDSDIAEQDEKYHKHDFDGNCNSYSGNRDIECDGTSNGTNRHGKRMTPVQEKKNRCISSQKRGLQLDNSWPGPRPKSETDDEKFVEEISGSDGLEKKGEPEKQKNDSRTSEARADEEGGQSEPNVHENDLAADEIETKILWESFDRKLGNETVIDMSEYKGNFGERGRDPSEEDSLNVLKDESNNLSLAVQIAESGTKAPDNQEKYWENNKRKGRSSNGSSQDLSAGNSIKLRPIAIGFVKVPDGISELDYVQMITNILGEKDTANDEPGHRKLKEISNVADLVESTEVVNEISLESDVGAGNSSKETKTISEQELIIADSTDLNFGPSLAQERSENSYSQKEIGNAVKIKNESHLEVPDTSKTASSESKVNAIEENLDSEWNTRPMAVEPSQALEESRKYAEEEKGNARKILVAPKCDLAEKMQTNVESGLITVPNMHKLMEQNPKAINSRRNKGPCLQCEEEKRRAHLRKELFSSRADDERQARPPVSLVQNKPSTGTGGNARRTVPAKTNSTRPCSKCLEKYKKNHESSSSSTGNSLKSVDKIVRNLIQTPGAGMQQEFGNPRLASEAKGYGTSRIDTKKFKTQSKGNVAERGASIIYPGTDIVVLSPLYVQEMPNSGQSHTPNVFNIDLNNCGLFDLPQEVAGASNGSGEHKLACVYQFHNGSGLSGCNILELAKNDS